MRSTVKSWHQARFDLEKVMQIRQSIFQSSQFKCPFGHEETEHCLHKNGNYKRYANAKGDSKVTIQRLLCKFTSRTISILPDGMLPYWAVPVTEVEDHFDQKSAQGEDTTPSAQQASERAWNRFSSAKCMR